MSNYTVGSVVGKREFETKNGPLVSYKMQVTGDDGFSGIAELVQKPATPAPTEGQTIEGTLDKSNPQFPPKLKKAQQGQGGGRPPMGKSKADQDSIERAVAYKGAVDLACAMPNIERATVEGLVERFFHHGLTLLQGKVHSDTTTIKREITKYPPEATAPDPGPTKEELTKGYHAYMNGAVAIGQSQEEATQNLKLKKTALGIDSVEAATPEQKREILNFFNSI
jgi:hypothetical protein